MLAVILGEEKTQHDIMMHEKEGITKRQKEWNEERTGLLSGTVHYDKYPSDSLVQVSDDCDSSDEYNGNKFGDLKSPFVLGGKSLGK